MTTYLFYLLHVKSCFQNNNLQDNITNEIDLTVSIIMGLIMLKMDTHTHTHMLTPQFPVEITWQAALCLLTLTGWVALFPWHLVATATRSLALIHHPDQDWHLMTSSLPISQACCYYECPSVCHLFSWAVGGVRHWCREKQNGEQTMTSIDSLSDCNETEVAFRSTCFFHVWTLYPCFYYQSTSTPAMLLFKTNEPSSNFCSCRWFTTKKMA